MALTYQDETAIKTAASPGTVAMLDRWHTLSEKHFGQSVPVIVASRYDSPTSAISQQLGEFNTTTFGRTGGNLTLIVWLEQFGQPGYVFDDVLVSHEVGHRIVSAEGFYVVGTADPAWHLAGGLLYSLAQHSPIYEMQRTNGIAYRSAVDRRASQLINGYVNQTQAYGVANAAVHAMVFADDILNASQRLSDQLRNVILPQVLAVQKIADRVLYHATKYNLLDVSENSRFMQDVINDLAPQANWVLSDGLEALQSEIAAVP